MYLVQRALGQTCERQGCWHTDHKAYDYAANRLAYDQPLDLVTTGTQRDPNSDLCRPTTHGVGQKPVEANRG